MSRLALACLAVSMLAPLGCTHGNVIAIRARRAPNLTNVDINALDQTVTITATDSENWVGDVSIDKASGAGKTARQYLTEGQLQFDYYTDVDNGGLCFTFVGFEAGVPAVFAKGCSLVPQPAQETPLEVCVSPTGPEPLTCIP